MAIFRRISGVQFDEVAKVALPAADNPSAPILLTARTFDDKFRAVVSDLTNS